MKDVWRFAKGLTVVLGFLFVAFLFPLDYVSILLGCIVAMAVVLILRFTLKRSNIP